jgi:ketosteroid isomerase-like protein
MRNLVVCAVLGAASTAYANDLSDIGKLVDAQFGKFNGDVDGNYTPDAITMTTSSVTGAHGYGIEFEADMPMDSYKVSERDISISRDGKSAWVSLHMQISYVISRHKGAYGLIDNRVSELVVKTAAGWRVAARAITEPLDDKFANSQARANKLGHAGRLADEGDEELRAAFAKLVEVGFAKPEAAARQLVVFGSAPNERTTSGPAFAKAWNAAWAKHVDVDAATAWLAPSKTTGWIIANVQLRKGKGKDEYRIPFRLFFVFDKDKNGAWQLVHAQFAVPT